MTNWYKRDDVEEVAEAVVWMGEIYGTPEDVGLGKQVLNAINHGQFNPKEWMEDKENGLLPRLMRANARLDDEYYLRASGKSPVA